MTNEISALEVVLVAYAALAGMVALAYLYIGVATGSLEFDALDDDDEFELEALRGYAATGYWIDECGTHLDPDEADGPLEQREVRACN